MLTPIGCENWEPYSGLGPINYLLYILGSVNLSPSITSTFWSLSNCIDLLCMDECNFGSFLRTVRCWFWYLGNQMHYRRLCDEGISRFLDTSYQIYMLTTSHLI